MTMINKLNINANQQIRIVYIVLILVTLAVFWQVKQFEFVNIDDPVYVIENRNIQSGITLEGIRWAFSTTYAEFWHPLTWLSLMFDYQLYGLNAGGYHLTNLIIHIMSVLLLFWLFNHMTWAIWRSAFVAALFALHPLHVESVVWIAERKDVLSAFFWMLTLCLYVYYIEKPVIERYLLVLFCFACGLMSKSMIVTLPVVMILLDYWPLDRLISKKRDINFAEAVIVSINRGKKQTKSKKADIKKYISPPKDYRLLETKIAGIIPLLQLKEKIPFFILSAVFAIITLYAQHKLTAKDFPFESRLANVPVSFVTYLEKTFWPHDLAVFYPFLYQLPLLQVFGATLLIIIVSTITIATVKRLPYLFVGWLWYAITILPVIGIIQVGQHAMADRYTYLPLIGIGILLAWGMPALIKREEMRKKILFPAGVGFLMILSFLAWQQCGYWKNSTTLFSHALEVTKNNDLAHSALGAALAGDGKIDEAIIHYRKAIKINPNSSDAHYNLGRALKDQGKMEEALSEFREAVRSRPSSADAHNNMGIILEMHLKKYDEAIYHYRQALQNDSKNSDIHFNLGIALAKSGKIKEAIEHFRQAIYLKPYHENAHRALKLALELDQQNR